MRFQMLITCYKDLRKLASFQQIYLDKVAQGILVNTGHSTNAVENRQSEYILISDAEEPRLGMFDKPLPCFGCGIGWFSLLLGFVCPLMWYFATILYFGRYYHKDPRERSGLAACAIAATICTIAAVIALLVILL